MNHNVKHNADDLRKRLKELRAQQATIETNRGALLIRGRLFTWFATNRTRLLQQGKPVPRHIAAFYPMAGEPDLFPLLNQWVEEEGLQLSLPVVTTDEAPLTFYQWTPETPMETGKYGIDVPQSEPVTSLPDIVLVPTLGYTRQGDRVGYGKGYYDRTLAQWREQGHHFIALGIAWAVGDLSGTDYQPAAHDQRLDAILTDKGWAVPAPEL
ncbi:5-formyltetrahydrofolate cyclo-ligase [Alcaligenes endophyticus]|uniref:5-formyltetrahydrofolate cyclo-ligase n=1 Tax=Alcaligenes endophyticus TaxID=1929088 RepID=A0ABT8EG92_9BURK|nr:5-formyltetrahydrofolate cyclo-ligase [Alcaligenes endophyticus]MCX5590025.1 5-formyltetrahydrofolate cyclo-ligase [Alcaligenes endophyticus]MDN4120312.1 5-formyltetrahydrofolate cyclo-ligase [Alcaligenes endophyticus]